MLREAAWLMAAGLFCWHGISNVGNLSVPYFAIGAEQLAS
jgi:hypothetical protein